MARITFPIYDVDEYGGRIHFQVMEEIPVNVSWTASRANDGSNRTITPAEYRLIDGDAVSLYMPQALQFTDGVQFEEFSLGAMGAGTEAAIKTGANAVNAAMEAAGEAVGSAVGSLSDMMRTSISTDAARFAAARVAAHAPGAFSGALVSAAQTQLNPNKRMLFQQVNIRNFAFTFKLIPSSREEATAIKRIIKFFRTELYPEEVMIVGGIPLGYKFPNRFRIKFMHNSTPIAHKMLDSYLTNINVTYNGSGMGFFDDGNFTEADITLSFREYRTLSKQDILGGHTEALVQNLGDDELGGGGF